MRLVTFVADGITRLGVRQGDTVVDLNAAHAAQHGGHTLAADMRAFIEQGPDALAQAQATLAALPAHPHPPIAWSLAGVRLLAPIPNPSKIIAVGLNYWDHCRENNLEPPKKPILFVKFTTSLIGTGDAITWDGAVTQEVDYEVELAFVVGRRAKAVKAADAPGYIFGYTICNDISARDLQRTENQWCRAKSLDTFCPLGPEIVTADELGDPQSLDLRCLVNGVPLQNSNTKEMVFTINTLFEFISSGCTLLPGDVVTTGTPDGVGSVRKPPILLKPGDTVACEIVGIGRLENPVR